MATEHIRLLEVRNAFLLREWQELRGRVEAFEGLLAARAGGALGAGFGFDAAGNCY
jgi:hypothetical protein